MHTDAQTDTHMHTDAEPCPDTCTHMHAVTYIRTYTCTDMHREAHTHVQTCTHMHTHMHIRTYNEDNGDKDATTMHNVGPVSFAHGARVRRKSPKLYVNVDAACCGE